MSALDQIAERRIQEAMERGDFNHLQGHGSRVVLDRDQFVAPELRMAYRILANAGCSPEEVRIRKELGDVRAQLARAYREERDNAVRRLNLLLAKLETCREGR